METDQPMIIKDIEGVSSGAEERAIQNGATESDIKWFRGVVEKAQNSPTRTGAHEILQKAQANDPTIDRLALAA